MCLWWCFAVVGIALVGLLWWQSERGGEYAALANLIVFGGIIVCFVFAAATR